LAVEGNGAGKKGQEDGEMPEPPPRRNTATEIESKVSAGKPFDLDELLGVIDGPMHDELVYVFRESLSDEEREDLARDVFVELCESPTKYQVTRASLPTYAKLRVRSFALDYLEDRKKACKQQRLFDERAHLQLAPEDGPGPAEAAEQRRVFNDAVDRVRIAILQLPLEQQLAAEAYKKYGPADFASRLAAQLDVSPNRVSQWWTRAKRALREAIGPEVDVFE